MQCEPYDQSFVDAVRAGGPDANGQPAERAVSDGAGNPCRSCLRDIARGEAMLVLAARPFPVPQPYAETGPIFLHAESCTPWRGDGVPPVLETSPDYLVKGYGADDRIRYGTGAIVAANRIAAEVAARLARDDVAYVDLRSARNNCFLTRVRGSADIG
ncbi:DUF1203 domain-containing protein [Jannaschia sp. KMU-145]|uniref:DUF1203 domain-containing protein n=1 Tax=Jannaschia halovivens TaxID=3388667 RepID=UPI00396B29BC